MPVDGVVSEEPLDFDGDLVRTVGVGPLVDQLVEHGVGAAALLLAQSSKHTQLGIGHPHLLLISLCRGQRCGQ